MLLTSSGWRRPGGHRVQEDAARGDCTISSVKGVRAGRKRGVIAGGGGMVKKIASSSAAARAPEAAARRSVCRRAGILASWRFRIY